jgi:hypothetical protein
MEDFAAFPFKFEIRSWWFESFQTMPSSDERRYAGAFLFTLDFVSQRKESF